MKKFLLSLFLSIPFISHGQIFTKSYDTYRTSENRTESVLTPQSISKLGILPRIPCIGDGRGCEAQPLIDGNIMILASEANVIRGVNPDGGSAIWQTAPLCTPIQSSQVNDMWRVQDHFGMMSTGVIDPDTHKLYQVGTCSADGSGNHGTMQQQLFVLDTRTGQVLDTKVIDAVSNGQRYSQAPRKQRAALALWKQGNTKFVVMCAGSFSEFGPTATGWIIMIDTFDDQVKTSLSLRAGVWGSGQGPVITDDGYIYLGTGNGVFNGLTDFGESALKLLFTPPTAQTPASLRVVGDFVPFLDSQRECAKAALTTPTSQLKATVGEAPGARMPMAMNSRCDSVYTDQDAHLTWTFVKKYNQFISAGKDGIGMVIPAGNFPRTQVADFNTVNSRKINCSKVGLYQFGWNLNNDSCPDDLTTLNQLWGGKTRHQHAPPAQYNDAQGNVYLFFSGENSPIQVWRANSQGIYSYVTKTDVVASASVQNGMPGAFCSVSDNNGASGILWCSVPDGDANRTITTGRLYAFDLSQLATGKLTQIYKSDQYVFSKFSQPIVYNGIVILPDYAGSVMEWKTN